MTVILQFSSVQFSSVQFNSIQFNSIQFNSILDYLNRYCNVTFIENVHSVPIDSSTA
jgi:hypothetical protein